MAKKRARHEPRLYHAFDMRTRRTSRGRALARERIAIVVSRYNDSITSRMLDDALAEHRSRGGKTGDVEVIDAPGAFELPTLALHAAFTRRFVGVLALGCIIKGETSHDVHLARAVCTGLTEVSLRTGVPVSLGVLTVDTIAQARARAGGSKGNKGAEAMSALLDTFHSLAAMRGGRRAGISGRPDKARAPRRGRV